MAGDNTALILVVAAGAAYLAYTSAAQASTGPSGAAGPSSGGSAPPPPTPAPQGGGPGTFQQDPATGFPALDYATNPPPPNVILQIAPPGASSPWSTSSSTSTPKPWHVSSAERAAIKGTEQLRLTRYKDGAGYSIGYGHQIKAGDGIGTTITAARAQQLFDADIASVESTLNALVRVALDQNEIDALGDFVFNVGAAAFGRSTLLRLLNTGDYHGAAAQLGQWHYSAGQNVPALATRRAQEAALFARGLYG